jgi:transposase-like protein
VITTPRKRALRETEQAELVAAYESGAAVKELAGAYGLHRNTVSSILDRHGITKRRRGLTPPQLEQAIQLYRQGWSLARIAEALGFWDSTILLALRRAGVRTRDPQARERSRGHPATS